MGSLACGSDLVDPSLSLSQPDRERLAEFVTVLRDVYSRGDARGVEALIAKDFEHPVLDLARRHILPKGPTKILGYRIVPHEANGEVVFSLAGVDYGLTVEPLGTLVFDVEDVSVGEMEVAFVIGERDGAFRSAGFQKIP